MNKLPTSQPGDMPEDQHGVIGRVEHVEIDAELPKYQPAIFDESGEWPNYKWWRNPVKWWQWRRLLKKIKIPQNGFTFVGTNKIDTHEHTSIARGPKK